MAWTSIRRLITRKKKELPEGLFMRCDSCSKAVYRKRVEELRYTCPECAYHFSLSAQQRIELMIDEGTWEEYWPWLSPTDPLQFVGKEPYKEKIAEAQAKTGLQDAAVMGRGKVEGQEVIFGVTDSRFMMGSLGSVVGEKVTRGVEKAAELCLPFIMVSGSGGGARMYEGSLSLMQMAKTSAALSQFHEQGGLFLSILTNPTMAGVLASFASLGDVILAEPKALIGFTGPRVIQQTIKQNLPDGFQTSEFLLEHGFVDRIVPRQDLKIEVGRILEYCSG